MAVSALGWTPCQLSKGTGTSRCGAISTGPLYQITKISLKDSSSAQYSASSIQQRPLQLLHTIGSSRFVAVYIPGRLCRTENGQKLFLQKDRILISSGQSGPLSSLTTSPIVSIYLNNIIAVHAMCISVPPNATKQATTPR